jgi:endoglucanase
MRTLVRSILLVALLGLLFGFAPVQESHAQTLSPLHVNGNQLMDATGLPVVLRGVNRSGTEYACIQGWGIFDGPNDAASVAAIASWHVHAVNILLNEDCWLGINGVKSAYGGVNYQNAIVQYAQLLEANDIYPILSLHWSAPGTNKANGERPMPDLDHSPTFWKSVADTFKSDPLVLFHLFEEPYPNGNGDGLKAWSCWRDAVNCTMTWQAVGMQVLTNVVRGEGATNVIQLSGTQYANSLTRFLSYEPTDPLSNSMASVDVYPASNICGNVTCYDTYYAPVASVMPLMAGEFGESADDSVCGVDASNTFMTWMDAHHAGYDAWVWDTWGTSCADLSLILDYNGMPKAPNGTNYKMHLAQF